MTVDSHAAARADLSGQDISVDAGAISTRQCGDIAYVRIWAGWLFLATVINRASAGWWAGPSPITSARTWSRTPRATPSPGGSPAGVISIRPRPSIRLTPIRPRSNLT